MNRDSRDGCPLHGRHIPVPHTLVAYLVLPASHGGVNEPDNVVLICPTGHANTRQLLNLLLVAQGVVPYAALQTYARGERDLAQRSFTAITAVVARG